MASNLLTPYRAAGLVAGGQQLYLQSLGTENFLTTSIGKAFQVYRCDHLTLSMVSRPGASEITHVAAFKEYTFTASEGGITIWDRARQVCILNWTSSAALSDDESGGDVLQLLVEGELLFSLHADDVLRVWNWKSAIEPLPQDASQQGTGSRSSKRKASTGHADASEQALMQTVTLPTGTGVTCMVHPPTYVNKVAIGTRHGTVLIVNVRTEAVIYTAQVAPGSAITALTVAPNVVDVVAIGTSDGRVFVHNLRLDEVITNFSHAASDDVQSGKATGTGGTGVSITALSFSIDATLGTPYLASSTESGSVVLWDLEKKQLAHSLPSAHGGAVVFMSFFPKQPLLLTAGEDNAIRVFAIDRLQGAPKLLRSRSGHQAPPRIIRYYGGASVGSLGTGADASSQEIVSAGSDRTLRLFHTALPRQDVELSQGKLSARAKIVGVHPSALRLPQVVALACSDRRRGQWADLVTCHAGSGQVYCWNWEAKRLEDRALVLPNSARESAIAVCITACGNFAIVGGTAGTVCMFNLQSGARRGTYPTDPTLSNAFHAKGKKRAKADIHSDTMDEDGPGGDLGPVDRDVGKGQGPGHGLRQVDSIDTTLMKGIGILPPKLAAAMSTKPAAVNRGHTSAVYGIGSDAMNKYVLSADAAGRVVWWDFSSHAYISEIQLPAPVTGLYMARDAGLAALTCDDFCVRVVDISTRKLVRTFTGHSNRITDVCFSQDQRWLATASVDRSLRIWDLPTARCIDWCTFQSPVVSMCWSPTGEFLTTAHADSPALCLWANKAHFGSGTVADAAPAKPFAMDMPKLGEEEEDVAAGQAGSESSQGGKGSRAGGKRGAGVLDKAEQLDEESEEEKEADVTVQQDIGAKVEEQAGPILPKAGTSITLSCKADSAWVDLPQLESIIQRNKPKAPPKKPEAAPFFLPTTGGLAPTFVAPAAAPSVSARQGALESLPDLSTAQDSEEEEGAWEGAQGGNGVGGTAVNQAAGGLEAHGKHLVSTGSYKGRHARSSLAQLLRQYGSDPADEEASRALRAHLQDSSPQTIDIEVRTLCLGGPSIDSEGCKLLALLMRHLTAELQGAQPGFEMVNAHIGLLLDAYKTTLAETVAVHGAEDESAEASVASELSSALTALKSAQAGPSGKLREMIDRASCMVQLYLGQ